MSTIPAPNGTGTLVPVHEHLEVDGRVGRLRGTMLHHKYDTLSEHLATIDRYARIARNDLAGAAAQVNSYISRTRGGLSPTSEDRDNDVD